MKTKTKIILGGAAVIVLLIIVVGGALTGGIYYVYSRFSDPEMKAKIARAKADGTEFGKTTDQNGCMTKALTIKTPIDTFDLSNEEFDGACLHASSPTPQFCDGVPFAFDRKWFEDQCRTVGHNDDACNAAFIAKRNFCKMDSKD